MNSAMIPRKHSERFWRSICRTVLSYGVNDFTVGCQTGMVKKSEITLDNGNKTEVWTYEIKGKKIPAMMVYHPSSSKGKKREYWHQFYKKFLGL